MGCGDKWRCSNGVIEKILVKKNLFFAIINRVHFAADKTQPQRTFYDKERMA